MPGNLRSLDLAKVTCADFLPFVGSAFGFETEAGTVSATLVEAVESPSPPPGAEFRQSFSLLFQCDTALLNQGTYPVSHPEIETIALFVTPISGGADHCQIETVFN
jgi:hypothetical protein